MSRSFTLAAALAVAASVACGGSSSKSSDQPAANTVTVRVAGTVFREQTNAPAAFVGGVVVRATTGVGTATATTSSADGSYTLEVKAEPGTQVLVAFERSGDARLTRTFRIYSGDKLNVSPTMRPLTSLTCDSIGGCRLDDGKLGLGSLDSGVNGKGRVFNPATEITAFPGSFTDSSGNLLVSGVFSAVELKTAGGQPYTRMPVRLDESTGQSVQTFADLQMAVPKETWPSVRDMTPSASDGIVVPLYAFNEASGQWQYERDGKLYDETGALIPESALSQIRAGTFTGQVFARGQVAHFSWWNVDWPVDTKGCVQGKLLDANGRPAAGAVVSIKLSSPSHNGQGEPRTVGSDGTFCMEMLRSEVIGQDVDGDGVAGEQHQVALQAFYNGEMYDLGAQYVMSTTAATCGGTGCASLGPVSLTSATKLAARVCSIQGHVMKDGLGVGNAGVWAWDDGMSWDMYSAMCDANVTECMSWGWAYSLDPDGAYSVSIPLVSGASLGAYWTNTANGTISYRFGQLTLTAPAGACPAGQDIDLTVGFDQSFLDVQFLNSTFSWNSSGATGFWVQSLKDGTPKWFLEGAAGTQLFAGPVTYGVVPSGAIQIYPDPLLVSTIAPLAACDEIEVIEQSYSGQVYRLAEGECVLLDPGNTGVLTCHPISDGQVLTECLGVPVDPAHPTTDIARSWYGYMGSQDVGTGAYAGYSGTPIFTINADGTYALDLDSSGTPEVSGTWTWTSATEFTLHDVSGPAACADGDGTYSATSYGAYIVLDPTGGDPCGDRSLFLNGELWLYQQSQPVRAKAPGVRKPIKVQLRR